MKRKQAVKENLKSITTALQVETQNTWHLSMKPYDNDDIYRATITGSTCSLFLYSSGKNNTISISHDNAHRDCIYSDDYHTFNCSLLKSPKLIIKAIMKELPEITEKHQRVKKRYEERTQANNNINKFMKSLEGGTIDITQEATTSQDGKLRYYSTSQESGYSQDIRVSSSSVQMDLRSIPHDLASKILNLLKDESK